MFNVGTNVLNSLGNARRQFVSSYSPGSSQTKSHQQLSARDTSLFGFTAHRLLSVHWLIVSIIILIVILILFVFRLIAAT